MVRRGRKGGYHTPGLTDHPAIAPGNFSRSGGGAATEATRCARFLLTTTTLLPPALEYPPPPLPRECIQTHCRDSFLLGGEDERKSSVRAGDVYFLFSARFPRRSEGGGGGMDGYLYADESSGEWEEGGRC